MEFCDAFWQFVEDNKDSDISKLRLKYHLSKNLEFDVDFAITQIDSRQRIKHKLSKVLKNNRFIFPSKLSSEQCTSEKLALFHSLQLPKQSTLLDMTCGLGIDAIYSSAQCCKVTAIDINPHIIDCLNYNIKLLGIDNMTVINNSSIDYLSNNDDKFDIIYVDPARRSSDNKRTFALEDCEPNIIEHFNLIKEHCSILYIKVSPMLDLTKIVNSLSNITDLWILSLKNECKEVFIKCSFKESVINNDIDVHAIDFDIGGKINEFVYKWKSEINTHYDYIDSLDEIEGKWIYEPNSSIMKCGCWKELLLNYPSLHKFHVNTHLFLSDKCYEDFPGRMKRIVKSFIGRNKELKKMKGEYFNIVNRNYPKNVSQIKKELGVIDGGNQFLYCLRYGKEKSAILIAE